MHTFLLISCQISYQLMSYYIYIYKWLECRHVNCKFDSHNYITNFCLHISDCSCCYCVQCG